MRKRVQEYTVIYLNYFHYLLPTYCLQSLRHILEVSNKELRL